MTSSDSLPWGIELLISEILLSIKNAYTKWDCVAVDISDRWIVSCIRPPSSSPTQKKATYVTGMKRKGIWHKLTESIILFERTVRGIGVWKGFSKVTYCNILLLYLSAKIYD